MLASYLEDLASDTDIWNTFVRQHKKLYGKALPFYQLDDYYEEEINPEDVTFLIWNFMNTVQKEKFIAPHNEYIFTLADTIYDILDDAWDDAPSNNNLKPYYTIPETTTDFYEARVLIDTVMLKTYLFHSDVYLDNKLDEYRIIIENEERDQRQVEQLLQDSHNNVLHRTCTRLLGYYGKDWVAEFLGEDHVLYTDYKNMSDKIQGFFYYKGEDDENIFIEHVATNTAFTLTKKSFVMHGENPAVDSLLYIGIVKWQGEWWFSGVATELHYDEEIVQEEKNSLMAKDQVVLFGNKREKALEILQIQLECFKAIADGRQTIFVQEDNMEPFVKAFFEYYNGNVSQSKKTMRTAKKKIETILKEDKKSATDSDGVVIFFNKKKGITVVYDVASAFPDEHNPYYKADLNEDHTFDLIMKSDVSAELAYYCFENYRDVSPFFTTDQSKTVVSNFDFLLRFMKGYQYHTKLSMAFAGD